MSDCSNGAGYCRNYSSGYLHCHIYNNETELIKELISNCSNQSPEFTGISVYKSYESTIYGDLIIDIELPPNIVYLSIFNQGRQDYIRLITSSQNTCVTRIIIYCKIELESNNFFDYFTNLRSLTLEYMISRKTPSFTNLEFLTYLNAKLQGPATHTFDKTIVSGLANLRRLYFGESFFNGITEGAFDNMPMLTILSLYYNKIKYIEDGAFTGLSGLRGFILSNNGIETVSENVFEGLSDLTILVLFGNPLFPIKTFLKTRSLVNLRIQNNEYQSLDPYVFQQLNSLRDLYINDTFICDCRLKWTSIVSKYGLYIHYGVCFEPKSSYYEAVTNPQLYTNCTQTESYQCFDKSITCPSNEVCHNTEDSYFCGCQIGYLQLSTGQCIDKDECNEENNCQHSCENTEGSYHCLCEEGYKLATNGYDCDDVDECQEWNGGCEFGCGNTIGSFQCYCEYGHQLKNETHCESDIQCDIIDSSGYEENIFTCQGGFNLTITNLTRQKFPNPTTTNTTEISSAIILFATLIIVIGLLLIIIVILLIYILKKIRKLQNVVKIGNDTSNKGNVAKNFEYFAKHR